MTQRTFTVYEIAGPEGRSYIGFTCQALATRFEQHCTANCQAMDSRALCHVIGRLGRDNFTIRSLVDGLTFADAKAIEVRLIAESLKRGDSYNLRAGGGGFGRLRMVA